MKVSETMLLIFFTFFAGILMTYSLDMPYFSSNGFDVGFVPLNTSVAIITLSGAIGLRALLHRKKTQAKNCEVPVDSDQGFEVDQKRSLVASNGAILLLVAATAVMGLGSVLLPLAIVMAIVSVFFLRNSWVSSISMVAVSLAVIYLIFAVWLKIPIH
jgi:hypothetical protein